MILTFLVIAQLNIPRTDGIPLGGSQQPVIIRDAGTQPSLPTPAYQNTAPVVPEGETTPESAPEPAGTPEQSYPRIMYPFGYKAPNATPNEE